MTRTNSAKSKTKKLKPPVKLSEKSLRAALYARVSTHDQQTLPMQLKAMREYVQNRGMKVALEHNEVGSGAKTLPMREALMQAARRREIDLIVVWKLDRWGRTAC